eukprot:12282521-Alexandrium_andersonii.AAC.1
MHPSSGLAEVLAALRTEMRSPGLRARLLFGTVELKPGESLEAAGITEVGFGKGRLSGRPVARPAQTCLSKPEWFG